MVRKDACLFSAEIGKSYIQNMSFMNSQYKYNIPEMCKTTEKGKNALRTPRPWWFKVHTNPQGWLPPAALTGCGGRGEGEKWAARENIRAEDE